MCVPKKTTTTVLQSRDKLCKRQRRQSVDEALRSSQIGPRIFRIDKKCFERRKRRLCPKGKAFSSSEDVARWWREGRRPTAHRLGTKLQLGREIGVDVSVKS